MAGDSGYQPQTYSMAQQGQVTDAVAQEEIAAEVNPPVIVEDQDVQSATQANEIRHKEFVFCWGQIRAVNHSCEACLCGRQI